MGRSVLVTGGNRGIGLAVARMLAKDGDRVAITHRGETAPTEDGLFAVRCDVRDSDQVDAAVTAAEVEHGPVTVVVASAGITRDRLLLRMSDDDFDDVVDTNLTGAFRVVRRAARSLLASRDGRVVLIASSAGQSGVAGQANYAASKAGLVGMARSLAREFASRGTTVNVVAPGLTDTDMSAALSAKQRDAIVAQVPLRRMADPDEVAAAVRFLVSGEAAYITGAIVPVDGGMSMGH